MSWLTGTSAVPSGTTILASVPSSTASTSMVALSVSISAITSPGLTFSPSFLSHLARLPFSIVGDSAGIRMLIGMGFSSARWWFRDRAARAARRRPVLLCRSLRVLDLGGLARPLRRLADRLLEAGADALQRLLLAHDFVVRVGTRDVARGIDKQEPPRARIVEAAAQR